MSTKEQIQAGKEWLKECVWAESDDNSFIDELSDDQIIKAIKRHFGGGVEAFLATF